MRVEEIARSIRGWREIPTPFLVLNAEVVRRNINRLSEYGRSAGLGIRPHTKTHKSPWLAKQQLDAGAIGLTVAKVGEAETMAEVCGDILVAYPASDEARAARLARLTAKCTVRVACDSKEGVEALAKAAKNEAGVVGVLVDIDVGLGRTGVQLAAEAADLAHYVDNRNSLRLDGLMCYPGHIWDAPEKQKSALEEVDRILKAARQELEKRGLRVPFVSGGSTPTAFQSHHLTTLTEIRPGMYIFNDANLHRGGFCALEDCGAFVVATVVSRAVEGQVVVDAGSKTLASDTCIPAPESGFGLVLGYSEAKVKKLSEEHAQIDVSRCHSPPGIGEKVAIIPNHICPCVNLCDEMGWWEPESNTIEPLPVVARGKTF